MLGGWEKWQGNFPGLPMVWEFVSQWSHRQFFTFPVLLFLHWGTKFHSKWIPGIWLGLPQIAGCQWCRIASGSHLDHIWSSILCVCVVCMNICIRISKSMGHLGPLYTTDAHGGSCLVSWFALDALDQWNFKPSLIWQDCAKQCCHQNGQWANASDAAYNKRNEC